jgi:hypothetical protein
MGIEEVYARRNSTNDFNGYDKNHVPEKTKLKSTKFKVGDKVVVKGEDNEIYLKGTIISLVKDMHIEGKITKYSNSIRYPKGIKDVFVMGRNGKRNLNGEDFKVYKT